MSSIALIKVVSYVLVVFPDLGGPTTERVTGYAGPGGVWRKNLSGLAMNNSLLAAEDR